MKIPKRIKDLIFLFIRYTKHGTFKFTGYIYVITCKVNGKRYVGQTSDKGGVGIRWSNHIRKLLNNNHENTDLQEDWNKYDIHNFTFEVLHELKFSDYTTLVNALDDLEVMYISIWNLRNEINGYNKKSGGRFNREKKQKEKRASTEESKHNTRDDKISIVNPNILCKCVETGETFSMFTQIAEMLWILKGNNIEDITERFIKGVKSHLCNCTTNGSGYAYGYHWVLVDIWGNELTSYEVKVKEVQRVKCVETEHIFDSLDEAYDWLGKPTTNHNIQDGIKKGTGYAYKYHWVYVDEEGNELTSYKIVEKGQRDIEYVKIIDIDTKQIYNNTDEVIRNLLCPKLDLDYTTLTSNKYRSLDCSIRNCMAGRNNSCHGHRLRYYKDYLEGLVDESNDNIRTRKDASRKFIDLDTKIEYDHIQKVIKLICQDRGITIGQLTSKEKTNIRSSIYRCAQDNAKKLEGRKTRSVYGHRICYIE